MIGAALGAILAYACFLFLHRPAWFPPPVTSSGQQFDDQFTLTFVIASILFILLHFCLFLAIYLPRKRVTARHNSWSIETVWTTLATGLFLFLALQGARIWAGVNPLPDNPAAEQIEVYAQQFAWSFRYPGVDGKFGRTSPAHINDVLQNPFGIDPTDPAGRDDLTSTVLKVPAGREVILLLHSRDVIHDFFVRELRVKQDVVPGMEIPVRFRATVPGTYEIACSELCGLGHSQMRATMEVLSPAAYQQWKRERSSAATIR